MSALDRLTPEQVSRMDDENRAIWGRVAATYTEGFEALTGAAAEATLDASGVGRRSRVLDVGTGPGTLLGPALARGAAVTAIDLSDEMVSEVRRRFPDVDARVAKASDLPFDAESFDAVTFGFCLHHMAEPGAALAAARRVLRPGGRIAFTVWGELERLEAFGVAFAALGELGLGEQDAPLEPPLPMGRPLAEYEAALERAGFVQPNARNLEIGWRVRGGAAIVDGFERFFGLPSVLSDEQRAEFAGIVEQAVASRAGTDGTTYLPNPAILAAARTPC
jgi:SAM-dependent methyltransferase